MTAPDDPEAVRQDERRDEPRIVLLSELQGEVMVFQPMAITEIGRAGLQVETSFAFHLDSLHEFRLTLGDQPIVVKGRIIHCSIIDVDQEFVRYRSGIQFIELSDRNFEVIDAFVEAIKSGRLGG